MKLYTPTPIYDELDTIDGDYNEINPDHEIKYEIEEHIRELMDEEAELEDIIKHEPQ